MSECFPVLPEFRQLARKGNLIPVYADLLADAETPVTAYRKLKGKAPSFLLESIEGGDSLSRYSFIGWGARERIRVQNGTVKRTFADGRIEHFPSAPDPLIHLQEMMAAYHPVALPNMPPFVGGAVGYLAYDYLSCVEPTVPMPDDDPTGMPLMHYLITDALLIFDRARQTLRILVNAYVEEGNEDESYAAAVAKIEHLKELLNQPKILPSPVLGSHPATELPEGNFSLAEFSAMVDRAKEYIRDGDIIQAVLSQRFDLPFAASPLSLYRALRTVNPSPYMVLFETDDYAIIGASPEVHVRLTGDVVEIRPIAGTRPRGKSWEEDHALEKDLLADPKERAEHLMLVDLARNDISRVCQPGSVTVPEYMIIERYSHVMHIVSQVTGKLKSSANAFDLMRATFPAGTVSGAPKVRAAQIISELEKSRRGAYAGAFGYFSFDGNHDSCIAIRTAVLRGGTLHVQSGAGVVADSIPENEFIETQNKAKGMLRAVSLALGLPEESF
jgi:anthranilate synthase component 1